MYSIVALKLLLIDSRVAEVEIGTNPEVWAIFCLSALYLLTYRKQLFEINGRTLLLNSQLPPVAPTAIKFLNSDKLGTDYMNDIFVGDANTGRIYNFDLSEQWSALQLYGSLKDTIADNLKELSNITFANDLEELPIWKLDLMVTFTYFQLKTKEQVSTKLL